MLPVFGSERAFLAYATASMPMRHGRRTVTCTAIAATSQSMYDGCSRSFAELIALNADSLLNS